MATARDAEPVDLLRSKYAELARKYAQLVERLERSETLDPASYGVASLDSRTPTIALAVVGNGIELFNARFLQLSRLVKGPLTAIEGGDAQPYADVRALVLALADRVAASEKVALQARYGDAASDALLSLRLERAQLYGRPIVLVLAEDVTEHARRDQELTRTREAMLQRERLRVLGELAASIAHDLGNTLRGASFQLATVADPSVPQDRRAAAVSAVAQRVEIASESIARLHEFARTGSMRVAAVHLDRVVAQAAALVEIDFQSGPHPVRIENSLPELPALRGSTAELSLLFVNLLRNARDAMAEGGTIRVTARRKSDAIVVTVADRGRGIRSDVRRRLFEPFFTTKGTRGTGLGLWLAAGTMQRMGGRIEAMNRPGGGATFVLYFPLQRVSPAPPVSRPRQPGARRGRSAPAPRRRRRARRT